MSRRTSAQVAQQGVWRRFPGPTPTTLTHVTALEPEPDAQVILARLWFKRFYYGPLEWLWRAGTHLTTKTPFVRKPASET